MKGGKMYKYTTPRKDLIQINAPKYCLFLDREVITNVNYKKKDLTCVLAILLEYYKQRCIYGNDITTIACTVSHLWLNIVWSVKPSRRDKENFISSLNRLVENELITIIEEDENTITWNSMLKLDIANLIHDKQRTFIKFDSQDLDTMVEINYNTVALMLQVYINITSYFNMSNITEFDKAIQQNKPPIDINYDLYGKLQDIGVSCYASHTRLMTTKHNHDEPGQKWISEPTLIKILKLLEELGLIAIVVPNYKDGKENFSNHYCFPRHKQYVQYIADMMAKQKAYKRQQKINENK